MIEFLDFINYRFYSISCDPTIAVDMSFDMFNNYDSPPGHQASH